MSVSKLAQDHGERGIAGPSLLAHVLVAKFADHLPLYRQSVIYAGEGVDLNRPLMASWVGAGSVLPPPLVDTVRRQVLAATKLHADDTLDCKGIHPQTHLAGFSGVLQADAYAGFNALYENSTIKEAVCRDHARRKFYNLHEARPSALTTKALRRIAELYDIEATIR